MLRHRTFFWAVIAVTMLLLVGAEAVLYVIDPVGIWDAPIRVGRNHCKIHQELFTDIFKPYEYARIRPDIVYIGTSKVQAGFAAEEPGAYNFSMPGFPMSDMREYLRFAYRVHKPRVIYLGLDLISFSQDIYFKRGANAKPSFSETRLSMIAAGPVTAHLWALKDSLPMVKYVPETVEASRTQRDRPPLHQRGWFRDHGAVSEVQQDIYYDVFNATNLHTRYYKDFRYAPEAMESLAGILEDAREAGVEIRLFFNPMQVDERTVVWLNGHEEKWNEIKAEVANLHEVYDFDFLNDQTLSIRQNYFDFVHYNRNFGDRVKHVLQTGETGGIAYLLNAKNAGRIIREEETAYEHWREENLARVELMRFWNDSEQPVPHGAFREFIGF